MTTELLHTKTAAPLVRAVLVPRPQLIARLGEIRERRLAIVCAGAGCGKTTLVGQWLRTARLPFAWLSVDEGDNDPVRFMAYLVAALQRVDVTFGQAAQSMLQSLPPPSPQFITTSLLNDLAATTGPFVLVIDDYHLIRTLAIHEQLAYFVEHLPEPAHLVVISREDPPLPLARLRASDQVLEVRQDDLAFTQVEAADFLRRVMRLELSAGDVATLHRRTEGWIAGLQLAALSLRGCADRHRFVRSFAGRNRFVLDYLVQEVLQRQTAEVQAFLLRTSILGRLCASLCDQVAGRRDSVQLLHGLEQANVFTVALDEAGYWFRYHHLFADLLRHRLQVAGQEDVNALHNRASEWFAANGFAAEAVHHALAAGNWQRAAKLIERAHALVLQQGECATLNGWFRQLPEEVLHANPALCQAYALPLLLTGQRQAAESLLDRAEAQAGDNPRVAGAVAAARTFLAEARGDAPAMIAQAERALALLPQDDASNRNTAAASRGRAYWLSGCLAEAEVALREAVRMARRSDCHHARFVDEMVLARIMAARGRLRQAAEALDQLAAEGFHFPLLAQVHLILSFLHYEWNDWEKCERHLSQSLAISLRGAGNDYLEASYRMQARLRLAQGDLPAALAAIERWHQLAREYDVPARSRAQCTALQVQIALAQGDLALAERLAETVGENVESHLFYPFLGLTKARLLLAQGEKAAAAAELRGRVERAASAGWTYGLLAARVLLAVASEEPEERMDCLVKALRAGQPEGFLRTFVDVGTPLVPLLRQAALQGAAPEYVGRILAAIGAEAPLPAGAAALPEPPSERELEVLRLLAAGLSNQQIADSLAISLGTAKTHVHNLYGKLAARNRAEVVSRATALGLL